MNSTVLPYVAFCCLNLVQVRHQCNVNEFRNKIISLNNSETCLNREFVNLSLPTKWAGCKWSCLDKGFEAIQNLKPNSRCAEKIKNLNKRYTQIKRKQACKPVICNAMCENSTSGDTGIFFSEAIEHLQAVTRENMRSISN